MEEYFIEEEKIYQTLERPVLYNVIHRDWYVET